MEVDPFLWDMYFEKKEINNNESYNEREEKQKELYYKRKYESEKDNECNTN